MENSTGRLWCTRLLDREERANYTLRVGAERATEGSEGAQRKRRDLSCKSARASRDLIS